MNYLKLFESFDKTIDMELIKDIFSELTDTYIGKGIDINYNYEKSDWVVIAILSNRNNNSEISKKIIELTNRLLQYYYEETGDEIIACYRVGNYNYFNVEDKTTNWVEPYNRSYNRALALYFNYAYPPKQPPVVYGDDLFAILYYN